MIGLLKNARNALTGLGPTHTLNLPINTQTLVLKHSAPPPLSLSIFWSPAPQLRWAAGDRSIELRYPLSSPTQHLPTLFSLALDNRPTTNKWWWHATNGGSNRPHGEPQQQAAAEEELSGSSGSGRFRYVVQFWDEF
ncbi:hypothetical protein HanIR_Chr06g0289381 [Helianthus annuus]|nr:hypothetical protein HanIR_Chr06g0289381 [Helianthus annuus]KAJ0738624.1 hypothetical protein HanLR1_Chr06g0220391 [Helianthus annuus]